MTQPDLRLPVSCPSLRCEPEFVEQLDQPIDRLLGAWRLSRRAGHPPCPRLAGLECLGAGVAVPARANVRISASTR